MQYYALTDRGKVRQLNEDAFGFVLREDQSCGFFAVADGMGGQRAGEVASGLTISVLNGYFTGYVEGTIDDMGICQLMRRGISEANRAVFESSRENPENSGMGTTAVCAGIEDGKIIVLNIGDSRAYVVRDGEIRQLTVDHSYVEDLVRGGLIDREAAINHPRRNEITRAIGFAPSVEPDMFVYSCKPGDMLILCSDGLDRMLRDREILEICEKYKDPKSVCTELVKQANECGGYDNITVEAVLI